MKTVAGILNGVDEDLQPTGRDEPRELGRVSVDICVRYLLGLPTRPPPAGEIECPPTLTLRGRGGMWLTLRRKDPGRALRLSMKDGEEDQRIDEIQGTRRVRLFVEHWGEETELTAEFRLPPEVRARIAERERSIDKARRRRLAEGPARTVFEKRRGLFRTRHEVVVDREKGVVTERVGGRVGAVGPLSSIRFADVAGLEEDRPRLEVAVEVDGREIRRPIGEGVWTREEAARMAECLNDAIDLPESRRKILRYRRSARPGEQGGPA